jgi:hypothetical protein
MQTKHTWLAYEAYKCLLLTLIAGLLAFQIARSKPAPTLGDLVARRVDRRDIPLVQVRGSVDVDNEVTVNGQVQVEGTVDVSGSEVSITR